MHIRSKEHAEKTSRLLADTWHQRRQNKLTHTVEKQAWSCFHAQIHTRINQYAEPEPLRSLITASIAAVGFHTQEMCFWVKQRVQKYFKKPAPALDGTEITLYFNEMSNINLEILGELCCEICTSLMIMYINPPWRWKVKRWYWCSAV